MKAVKRPIALALLLAAFTAFAIEPPKDSPAPAPPAAKKVESAKPDGDSAPPASDAAKPAQNDPADAEEELPPLPPDAVPTGPPPQRFNPSEKVRADFPVSFPIDI